MRIRAHVIGMALVALLPVARAGAQTPAGKAGPSGTAGSRSPAVALVGSLRIEEAELEQQVRQALRLYRDRTQAELDPRLEPAVRRQVLENLIRQRLLALDGRRSGVKVSDAEAEAQLRRDPAFQQDGVFNEARYLALKAANPAEYARALAATRDAIAVRKLSEEVERRTRPDDVAIRAELERQLSRASIEFLALRRAEFDGTYREPSEREVLAYYAANRGRYQIPEQATLSAIFVYPPAAGDSVGATDAEFRAWERRLRARADSALAAIRAGAGFADVARLHGGVKTGFTVHRDQVPDFWRGSARDLAAVFAARAGTVLAEPVRAGSGWALVRVDTVVAIHSAPLSKAAREIRRQLRSRAKASVEDEVLRSIYDAVRDSLRGDGYRVRYGLASASSFPPGEPTPQDLDRFYRAHLADYSSFDKASGSVVQKPLGAVRDEIRQRWMEERRLQRARETAQRVQEAWRRGRRDAAAERSLVRLREIGPIPAGSSVDSSQAGEDLAEALARRGGRLGADVISTDEGLVVYELLEVVPGYTPSFEQARPLLLSRLDARRAAEDEARAQRSFEADPSPFRLPSTIQFTHLVVEPPPLLKVELSRAEVERYFRSHLNEYSVEELVRIRHILISPSGPGADADAVARRRAEDVLKRVRAREDFAKLAAELSDDPATRHDGGDVGVFRRGQMREPFERAAFAMRPGDIAGPVRTEVGYHIMECLEYTPPIVHNLATVYANVANDCAKQKAKRLAGERADSIYRSLKNVAHAKAVAARLGLRLMPSEHQIGHYAGISEEFLPFTRTLETLKPGQFYPGTLFIEGDGHVITWVDTIMPPRTPLWREIKDQAARYYRNRSSEAALLAKKAELDSMLAGGWSFDSLCTLWGGLEKLSEASAGSELRGLGGKTLLDSLVFGRERAPALEPGQLSEWVEFPGGYARLRVEVRLTPHPEELAQRVEIRRQKALWRNLNEYFDALKRRYPVEILDGELRATALPEPSESDEP